MTVAVVLGSSRADPPLLEKLTTQKKKKKTGRQKMGSGRERQRERDSDFRGRKGETETESQRCLNFVQLWSSCQELNKRFISFWGADLFWCCEFLLHKSLVRVQVWRGEVRLQMYRESA